VHRVEDPAQLEGLELFVHVDLDVLDPLEFPASFPAPGGLTPAALRAFLTVAGGVGTIVGAEITSAAPGHGELVADAIAPLLAAG
jgi:arginase family enzyme